MTDDVTAPAQPAPDDDEADLTFRVVVNHEEQYSIWPADRDLPAGWREEGVTGTRKECLDHIDQVWTDMRPLSLRRYMEDLARLAAEGGTGDGGDDAGDPVDDEEPLVARLSRGDHPVELTVRPEPSGPAVREAVERGYVFVRFTGTRGGTELGVQLDRSATDVSGADFEARTGTVVLVGDLTLDFEPVRCTAEIDLTTLTGRGRLSVAASAP